MCPYMLFKSLPEKCRLSPVSGLCCGLEWLILLVLSLALGPDLHDLAHVQMMVRGDQQGPLWAELCCRLHFLELQLRPPYWKPDGGTVAAPLGTGQQISS